MNPHITPIALQLPNGSNADFFPETYGSTSAVLLRFLRIVKKTYLHRFTFQTAHRDEGFLSRSAGMKTGAFGMAPPNAEPVFVTPRVVWR